MARASYAQVKRARIQDRIATGILTFIVASHLYIVGGNHPAHSYCGRR